MNNQRLYHVFQTVQNSAPQLLYSGADKAQAEHWVDVINSNLAAAGIPSDVSYAYYE